MAPLCPYLQNLDLRSVSDPDILIYNGCATCATINSTQLTTPKEEWINKRKEAKKLIYIPDSLVNSQDVS